MAATNTDEPCFRRRSTAPPSPRPLGYIGQFRDPIFNAKHGDAGSQQNMGIGRWSRVERYLKHGLAVLVVIRSSLVSKRCALPWGPLNYMTHWVPIRACGDLDTWAQAQDFFETASGPESDPHRLDGDRDGVACETLPGAP